MLAKLQSIFSLFISNSNYAHAGDQIQLTAKPLPELSIIFIIIFSRVNRLKVTAREEERHIAKAGELINHF